MDGTLFYGPGKAWTDAIREFTGGKLKADDPNKPVTEQFPTPNDIRLPFANPPPPADHFLKPVSRFFSKLKCSFSVLSTTVFQLTGRFLFATFARMVFSHVRKIT